MKKITILLITFIFFFGVFSLYYPLIAKAKSPIIIINMLDNDTLPRMFRMTTSPYKKTDKPLPSRIGLDNLKASGSSQFSEKGLKKIIETIPSDQIYIVDLRQELHGFINGIAVSWYGDRNWAYRGKNLEEIEKAEQEALNKVLRKGFIVAYKHKTVPIPLFVKSIATEYDLAERENLNYIRLMGVDHMKPSDDVVDKFIAFVKELPEGAWLHFHCLAGKGRTTTFMVMYDMMRNANKVSYEDIMRRQKLIGGVNILSTGNITDWKYPYMLERVEFTEKFYDYVKQNPQFKVSWNQWNQNLRRM